jgi:hypothetical protein
MTLMRLSYLSPKTEVRESKIHGHGLFAAADISKDEVVAAKGGHIVDRKTLHEEVTPRLGPVEIQIDKDLFIAPVTNEERELSMLYSNHSCDPNLGVGVKSRLSRCVISEPAKNSHMIGR